MTVYDERTESRPVPQPVPKAGKRTNVAIRNPAMR
jgi:hypothetical protein